MKILNLYAGIGGNRKLWGNEHDITAIEYDKNIAAIYKDLNPNDTVIVADAHEYLLEHFKEYDFIWASPPCPTHSKLRLLSVNRGLIKLEYPDMKLYQEIIILQSFFKGKYVVENVIGYYEPLIIPQKSGHHYFWSNIVIPNIKTNHLSIKNRNEIKIKDRMNDIGIFIDNWHEYKGDKHKLLKNCVYPEIGLSILNKAMNIKDEENVNEPKLF
jgi:DNA (cytosine-5)-methyltransferase 1